ncbi:MAG: PfkB family carbohydrate kinase [Planctomycetota bacterium]
MATPLFPPRLPPMSPTELVAALDDFAKLRIVVVGDFFVDEYVTGEMFEISKEGPIPVVRFESRVQTPGAAGNLASSIRKLGANVSVVGFRGDDSNGDVLQKSLAAEGIDTAGLLVLNDRPTLTYTKFRARVESAPSREILRLDVLPDGPADRELEDRIIDAVTKAAPGADGIIVLDQVHHLITERVVQAMPAIAQRHTAKLHGSSREHIRNFRDFDLILPNDLEACGAVEHDFASLEVPGDLESIGEKLRALGQHRQMIVTLGPAGMALFPHDGSLDFIPSYAEDVVDVTGAGDAVASTAMLGNALGWDLESIAWAASQSAAIALAQVGTHHVTKDELAARLREAESHAT